MSLWCLGPLGGLAEKHVRLVSGSSASNTDASISIVRVRKLYDFSVGTVVYVRVRSNVNVAKEIKKYDSTDCNSRNILRVDLVCLKSRRSR